MEKTSKITRTIYKTVWENPKGGQVFYHEIELENGDKGQIGCKEKEPSKISPGQELNYTIEVTERGNKIKAIAPKFNGGGGGGRPQQDPKTQMISFSMSYAKDLIVGGKADLKELESTFERIYKAMTSKLS